MDANLKSKLMGIDGVTEAMVEKLEQESLTTPQRIKRRTPPELATIMGCPVPVAEDVLDAASEMAVPAPTAAPSASPLGSGGTVKIELVDPRDLSGLSDADVAARFGEQSERRNPHLRGEFKRRTGGMVVVDASGQYMAGLNAGLMERVAARGSYGSETFALGNESGFVIPLTRFLEGMSVLRSPFSRVELNEDGTDPTMAGVTYPVGDESAMVKLGWIAAYGKGFDFADPDTVGELIDMVTGKEAASRKVRALLDSYQHAVTMNDRQKLAAAEALIMRANVPANDGQGGHTAGQPSGDERLTRLTGKLPAEFDMIIFKLRINPAYLSGTTSPRATRATEVIRYLEQQGRLAELDRLLG